MRFPNDRSAVLTSRSRCFLGLSVAWVVVGCSEPEPPPRPLPEVGALARPITRDMLTSQRFIAFSDMWSVPVPGGDPVRFLPDGMVENERAGLAGPWGIVNDSTVMIRGSLFRHRVSEGDLFGPFPVRPSPGDTPSDQRQLGTRILLAPR